MSPGDFIGYGFGALVWVCVLAIAVGITKSFLES